jgi:putative FmdB family regulatory protein
MPTYVYRCSQCKHQFEKYQKFNDPPIERCPNCRRKTVHKVLQPAPIQFKGSGWYSTDSKSSSAGANGKSAKKKKEPAGESKTESSATAASSTASPGSE